MGLNKGTAWTVYGINKARFAITAVLNWSLKSVMFSLMTCVSTKHSLLAWKVDRSIYFDLWLP